MREYAQKNDIHPGDEMWRSGRQREVRVPTSQEMETEEKAHLKWQRRQDQKRMQHGLDRIRQLNFEDLELKRKRANPAEERRNVMYGFGNARGCFDRDAVAPMDPHIAIPDNQKWWRVNAFDVGSRRSLMHFNKTPRVVGQSDFPKIDSWSSKKRDNVKKGDDSDDNVSTDGSSTSRSNQSVRRRPISRLESRYMSKTTRPWTSDSWRGDRFFGTAHRSKMSPSNRPGSIGYGLIANHRKNTTLNLTPKQRSLEEPNWMMSSRLVHLLSKEELLSSSRKSLRRQSRVDVLVPGKF